MKRHEYHVYILMNERGTVLYVGMTARLFDRLVEHRTGRGGAFTRKYRTHRLVYMEVYREVNDAIRRETQIKAWRREKKEELIRTLNPRLIDLTSEVMP